MTKPQAPVGERDGEWQLVPKEATQEMIDAIASDSEMQVVSNQDKSFREIWRAMLAAAPSPPPDPTIDTTKLNAGQLVQRIMRVMDSSQAHNAATAAEEIAKEILDLPADYWHHPAPAAEVVGERVSIPKDWLAAFKSALCWVEATQLEPLTSSEHKELADLADRMNAVADAAAPSPPPKTRAEDWRSGSVATYRGGIASAALTNGATYVVNAIILAHGAKYLRIITDDKTVRDLLSTHFTNTTSTSHPQEEILRAAKVAFEVDWPKDDWTRFKVGDHARERYINMARAILALPLNPAATSEGGE